MNTRGKGWPGGRPRHPSPFTGSPRGLTCGFSPAERNTQRGHPLMCPGSRVKPGTLPSIGTPGVLHPVGGCRCGSSSFDKGYFYFKGGFAGCAARVMHVWGFGVGGCPRGTSGCIPGTQAGQHWGTLMEHLLFSGHPLPGPTWAVSE